MSVHENVAFDPRIGAVQVEHVVSRTSKDIIVVLDNRLAEITIAAGKVHDVHAAAGGAEKAFAHDPAPAAFDSAGAVQGFEGGGGIWENATADQKRAVVE